MQNKKHNVLGIMLMNKKATSVMDMLTKSSVFIKQNYMETEDSPITNKNV